MEEVLIENRMEQESSGWGVGVGGWLLSPNHFHPRKRWSQVLQRLCCATLQQGTGHAPLKTTPPGSAHEDTASPFTGAIAAQPSSPWRQMQCKQYGRTVKHPDAELEHLRLVKSRGTSGGVIPA